MHMFFSKKLISYQRNRTNRQPYFVNNYLLFCEQTKKIQSLNRLFDNVGVIELMFTGILPWGKGEKRFPNSLYPCSSIALMLNFVNVGRQVTPSAPVVPDMTWRYFVIHSAIFFDHLGPNKDVKLMPNNIVYLVRECLLSFSSKVWFGHIPPSLSGVREGGGGDCSPQCLG